MKGADGHGGSSLKLPRVWIALLSAFMLAIAGSGAAQAQSAEERYVQTIWVLLIEENRHLSNGTAALADCLANFTVCLTDPAAVVQRLNDSRNGLVGVRDSVLSLSVPARYQAVNDLVNAGLSHSIDGTALQIEGLEETSLTKFEAGSNLMAQGRAETQEAIDLLEAMPPRTALEEVLLVVMVALGASLASSVVVILWWYRRRMRERPSNAPTREKP